MEGSNKTADEAGKLNSSIKLAQSETYRNFCSPLTCLAEIQESMQEEVITPIIRKVRIGGKKKEKVYLEVKKKKPWSEIWNQIDDGVWSRNQDPDDGTSESTDILPAGN